MFIERQHVLVRGLRIVVHAYGDPTGRPLLCLHGFLDHGSSFRFMAEHLPGYRVVAPDMRGHGESEWVGPGGYYHFYDYYDDCRAVIEAFGWSQFSLLGHSMGGSVATGLAALEADRVDRLVLLEGMGPPFGDLTLSVDRLRRWVQALRKPGCVGGPDERRMARRVMESVDDAARRIRTLNQRLPEARAKALAETSTEPVAGGVCWRYDPLHRTPAAKPFVRGEAEAIWRGIRAPVLSIHGAESPWRPEHTLERHRTLGQVLVGALAEAGHNLHHDQPERLAQVVKHWLSTPSVLPAGLNPS